MIVKEDFLKKLRSAFDLNIYEVKVWTALLSKGVASAGEISEISDVPRSRSYDVLETLEKKGFVVMKLGKPIKYLAVNPDEVLRRVKSNVQKDADEHVKMLDSIKDTQLLNELNLLYKNGIVNVDLTDVSGSIKGRKNLYDHLESILRSAKNSVIIATSDKGIVRKSDAFFNVFKKLSSNNIKIKIATKITDNSRKTISELSKIAEVRDINMNGRFVVVDNKEVVFMVSDDSEIHENYDNAIWTSSNYFASALTNLFNNAWEKPK